jgi:hypothetical protein
MNSLVNVRFMVTKMWVLWLRRDQAVHSSVQSQQISKSPCVGRLKIKEWLKKMNSKHWAATAGLRRHMKPFIGRPFDEQS